MLLIEMTKKLMYAMLFKNNFLKIIFSSCRLERTLKNVKNINEKFYKFPNELHKIFPLTLKITYFPKNFLPVIKKNILY